MRIQIRSRTLLGTIAHHQGTRPYPRTAAFATASPSSILLRYEPRRLQTPRYASLQRAFTVSPRLKMDISSPERNIKLALGSLSYSKFGFVCYRTVYTPESDALWSRFQEILHERARVTITESDTPELLDLLDYRFMEDRARLDGATVATLRTEFDAWRRSPEAQAEQPGAEIPVYDSGTPRYEYCIRVDAEALESVVVDAPQPPDPDVWGEGFVHFIKVGWRSGWDDGIPEGEKFAPIEGCEEEDVGWFHMAQRMLVSDAYDTFCEPDIWYSLYLRPPGVVAH